MSHTNPPPDPMTQKAPHATRSFYTFSGIPVPPDSPYYDEKLDKPKPNVWSRLLSKLRGR